MLQRCVDTGYRLTELLAQRISAVFDPRARLLRQRRRALRWGLTFGLGCLVWVLVTAVLASWTTPAWELLATGLLAAGAAAAATLLLLRYRWLRSVPLPPPRSGAGRRLPPPGSAARPAISALGAAERGLFALLGMLERGRLLPAGEIVDLTAVANRTAATMAATAIEVVAMERAVRVAPDGGAYLASTINAFTAQLDTGLQQYNEMVAAAAQLVTATDSPMSQERHRAELTGATDRLVGWAQAFDELGVKSSAARTGTR